MTILLDIDGVLVTTPAWRPVESHTDGFMKFNERATRNLIWLLEQTHAAIVLTTTHRINYSLTEWKAILSARGIDAPVISKVNNLETLPFHTSRAAEIQDWADRSGTSGSYVIIDDDLSINGLPALIKVRFVLTRPLIGLDEESTKKALQILRNN